MSLIQHKKLHEGQWAEMPFALQMANIGSEVSRCIRWKSKGNPDRAEKAFFRALELMDLTIDVNISFSGRLRELCRAREELCEYFIEADYFDVDHNSMMRYYDQFALVNSEH